MVATNSLSKYYEVLGRLAQRGIKARWASKQYGNVHVYFICTTQDLINNQVIPDPNSLTTKTKQHGTNE